jgi:hypothetical protein
MRESKYLLRQRASYRKLMKHSLPSEGYRNMIIRMYTTPHSIYSQIMCLIKVHSIALRTIKQTTNEGSLLTLISRAQSFPTILSCLPWTIKDSILSEHSVSSKRSLVISKT